MKQSQVFANVSVMEEYIDGWKYCSYINSPLDDENYSHTIQWEMYNEYVFKDGSSVAIVPGQVGSQCYV